MDRQRSTVKEMMQESWKSYVRYAGQRARRLYQDSEKGWAGKDPIRNVVASMGTLWVMDMKDQFQIGENWLRTKLDVAKLDAENIVSYFIADYIGGLLEVYALSGRTWYKDKAKEIATLLKKAYSPDNGKSAFLLSIH